MPSSSPRVAGANENARQIVQLCYREMEASGFDNRKGTTLWRRTNIKYDVLKFDVIPGARCRKWRVPAGSFSLDPSCLFPFLPRIGSLPSADVYRPEKGYGQIRLSVHRGMRQPSVKSPNIWWAGDDAKTVELVLKDVLGTLHEKVLPFFGRFENIEELLRTFVQDEDAIGHQGVWDFGKMGSPNRLLYIAFAALECGEWDVAISNLLACRERTLAIPAGVQVQAWILPYVDQGLACAEHRRPWSAPL